MDFSKILSYQGIIFDLDGTLIDSMKYHIKAWQLVGEQYGISIPTAYLQAHGGVPSAKIACEIVEKYELKADPNSLADQKTAFYVSFIPRIEIYPLARELLVFARTHKLRMAIATGTLRSNVEKIMKLTELKDFFSIVVSSEDVTRHKPEPDTFLVAAQKIDLTSQDCIVFEDAPLGIQAAKNGHFDCCVVKDGLFDLNSIIKAN